MKLTLTQQKAVEDFDAYCDIPQLIELLDERLFKFINQGAFSAEQNEDVLSLKRFMNAINSDSSQINSDA